MAAALLLVIHGYAASGRTVVGQFGYGVDEGAAAKVPGGEPRVKLIEHRQHLACRGLIGWWQGLDALT